MFLNISPLSTKNISRMPSNADLYTLYIRLYSSSPLFSYQRVLISFPRVLCATYQRVMFHLPEDRHVLFPEDRMWFSQRIIYHFPEDSAFFPEDRMCFSQRINVHFPEDRLFHFPKSYFHSLRGYFK